MEADIPKVEDIFKGVLNERGSHPYPIAETLRRVLEHPVVSFEGMDLRVIKDRKIQDGDFYFSGRSPRRGVLFLEAATVDWENGWVLPTPSGYPFDIWECVVVEPVE